MEELIIVNGTQLANKELAKKVNVIIKADNKMKASQWDITYALTDIVYSNLYKDDFKDLAKFAEFVGLSKASISQYKGARKALEMIGCDRTDLSVGTCYLLSTLINQVETPTGIVDDCVEMFNFLEWCEINNYDIKTITQKALRNAINEYKTPTEADTVEADTVEADTVEADTVEADTVEADTVEADTVEYTLIDQAKAIIDCMEVEDLVYIMSYIESRI